MKKILTYIITLSLAASLALPAYAEENTDVTRAETSEIPTESSDNSPIIVVPWPGSEETSSETPEESETTSEIFVDPFNPTDTTEPPPSDTLPVDVDPNDPPETSDTSDTSNTSESESTGSDISEDTTSSEPQVSLDTTPPTESEPPTETEPPETTTTTSEPVTQPPADTTEPTTEPITEPQTEPTYESTPETTDPPETTTTEAPLPSNSAAPPNNGIGTEPVDGDPDSFITTIVLIGLAIVVFILILIVPPIFRKIRKNIIYKYD